MAYGHNSKPTSLLTKDSKAQLSSWIGKRCQFELLYKISRDGCCSDTFHDICDREGPTVTILYCTDNTVYGGFLSQSWTSSGNYIDDPNAFLFILSHQSVQNPRKFPLTDHTKAAFAHKLFGPTFGEVTGRDMIRLPQNRGQNYFFSGLQMWKGNIDNSLMQPHLISFQNTVYASNPRCPPDYGSPHANNSNQVFNLNGEVNFGVNSDGQYMNMNYINCMLVSDLEVYSVKAVVIQQASNLRQINTTHEVSKQWREPPQWSEQSFQQLKDFVSRYKPLPDMKISEVNILLVGQINAGKSSFFNTLNSIFRGEISARACAGSSQHSLTTDLRKYRIRNRATSGYLNFRLCDTRGLEEEMSMHLQDMALLLDGHLSDQYKFNPMAHATQRDLGFVLNPTFQDKIHCVAFVVDGSSIDVIKGNVSQKLMHFRSLMIERGIPHVVFLTKLDKVCPMVDEDVRKIYQSQACKKAIETAADVIGIPRGHVFPVKNYEQETQLQTNVSIVALTAMRQTLVFADDYLEDQYELQSDQ